MASTYMGVPSTGYTVTVPSDGDIRNAASVVVPFQQLQDQIASCIRMQALNWEYYQFEGGVGGASETVLFGIGAGRRESSEGTEEILIAVGGVSGTSSAFVYSYDGRTWSERNLADADSSLPVENRLLTGVAYNSSLEMWAVVGEATGTTGLIMTADVGSVRGGTWTQRTPLTTFNTSFNAVAAVSTGFVAVGSSIGASPYIVSTNNGTSWQNQTVGVNAPLSDVCLKIGTDRWIAVGGNTGDPLIVFGNGVLNPVSVATLPSNFDQRARKCCWNGRVFAVINEGGDIFTSLDGETWIRKLEGTVTPSSTRTYAIAGDPDSGVLVHYTRDPNQPADTFKSSGVRVSLDDGANWDTVAGRIGGRFAHPTVGSSNAEANLFHMTYAFGRFVACGYPGTSIFDSNGPIVAFSLRR